MVFSGTFAGLGFLFLLGYVLVYGKGRMEVKEEIKAPEILVVQSYIFYLFFFFLLNLNEQSKYVLY